MSTPPTAAPGPHDGERRKSLGRYVKRMSSVFKREKPTKSTGPAPAGPAGGAGVASEATQTNVASEASAPAQEPAKPATRQEQEQEQDQQQEQPTEPPVHDLTPTTSISIQPPAPVPVESAPALDRNAMQQERARALFAKYGLTLETHEWSAASATAPLAPRVEKAIRMRVHRSCHRCGTLYGHDKICLQCEHKRCKKCPRYPKKKTPADQPKDKAKDKEPLEHPKKKKLLTLTTRSGNERVYQPATQRVKRTCHKCDAFFVPATATVCDSCSHVRCTRCPREPAKRSKWPSGYPGDVDAESDADDDDEQQKQLDQFRRIWRKPRRIVRWECEQCHGLFRQGSPQCPGCGHERCDQCTRSPVKKLRQEETFDPAIVAAVEAKLRALGVDEDPPTSEPEHA